MRDAYRISIGKHNQKRTLVKLGRRWKLYIDVFIEMVSVLDSVGRIMTLLMIYTYENAGCMESGELHDHLSDCQLLRSHVTLAAAKKGFRSPDLSSRRTPQVREATRAQTSAPSCKFLFKAKYLVLFAVTKRRCQ